MKRTESKKRKLGKAAVVVSMMCILGAVSLTGCGGTKKQESKPAQTQTQTQQKNNKTNNNKPQKPKQDNKTEAQKKEQDNKTDKENKSSANKPQNSEKPVEKNNNTTKK